MKKLTLAPLAWLSLTSATLAQSNWGQVAEDKPKDFSWTDPVFPGFWMAWTNATAAVFIFLFASIALMGLQERRNPGGEPRRGVLGLDTTRGDRLFISYLGGAFIFLGWIGIVGTPVWGGAGLAILWVGFVFWKV